MLKFKTFIPETIDTLHPIKPIDFKWFNKAIEDFKLNKDKGTHIIRCPGVNSILQTGWIQRTYQEIKITTKGDKKSFTCAMTYNQMNHKYGDLLCHYVSDHPPEMLDKFKPMNDYTLKTIIKIQSPWVAYVPKGYKLLQMPVSYSDENVFTASVGFLKDKCHLNVPIYWHKLNGEHIIQKGTPICQYLLIKDNDFDTSIEIANNKDYNLFKNVEVN